jgi:hypothetical protein
MRKFPYSIFRFSEFARPLCGIKSNSFAVSEIPHTIHRPPENPNHLIPQPGIEPEDQILWP